MGQLQGTCRKRGWGVVACIGSFIFALGGCCALYVMLLFSMMSGTSHPACPGPCFALVPRDYLLFGAPTFSTLGLVCGLIAGIRYRISRAWPAVGLCAVWLVITLVILTRETLRWYSHL